MNNEIRERYLKLALVVSGIAFLLIYPLGLVWPSGWVWHGGEGSYYLQLISGVYAVLSGEIPLTGNAASYVDKELDCTLSFNFLSGSLVLNQNGSCGMGLNVSAAGTYERVSGASPKFED